ncbi:hypothetical protein DFH08DRAFT_104200 [Mycena albidolilacea]|uniref:Uncharacterized protein n=1 Tax=Mycena albidolilacea TaxID=1033008 RepID=A0AAD6YXK8_9AGAR|nr:hypothetical protein DFH08DRAFT_104200 [Mycena albidolilacea]
MHRCLRLPELVGLVCSHLQSPYHLEIALEVRQPKRGDLAVLARTSTVFSSHALRLLWESVTLINLLRCLPSDSFEIRTTGEGYFTKYMMQLLRPLRSSDWERVLVYAQFVKHLSSDPDFADLSPVFPSISKNMLPNLQGLHWMHREKDFQYIDCFLAPQLTTIRIPHTSLDALSLLSSLALRCPQLTNITLFPRSAPDLQPLAVSAVSICVRGLHGIETLITDMVDEPALEHLSRLSGVRHLRLGELPPTLPAVPTDDVALFPSLQTLYFSSEIESPTRFLEWGNKLPLVEFTTECRAFSTADEVHRLFSAASGGISHLPLTGFAFDDEFGSLDSSHPANYLIRPQSLRSLFCFVNLTSVSILSAVGIDLDDTTVTDMARSWRHIECLELQSYYGNAAPRATLQCLEAFPKYCPHLTKLSITFDATVIPTSQSDLSLACLKNLDVEASPISTALPVARFLARMFPSLKNISTLRDSLDGEDEWEEDVGPEAIQYDPQWKEVESMLH